MKFALLVFLFGGLIANFAASQCAPEIRGELIKNPKSGLVLDGSKDMVTLETQNDSGGQLWLKKLASEDGSYIIINSLTGKVLVPTSRTFNTSVVTRDQTNAKIERWFISSNNIINNVDVNMVLDIQSSNYGAGRQLITYPQHGKENQLFKFTSPISSNNICSQPHFEIF